jgi:hypothetical protein
MIIDERVPASAPPVTHPDRCGEVATLRPRQPVVMSQTVVKNH